MRHPILILGAGPTGLSAAYHAGGDALLVEREARAGGWCRSIEQDGFTFDMAGHILFSNDPYVHELYRLLLGDNVHWQEREAWIYSKHVYTRYPFQGSLYGLPPEVIRECLIGAIEARYGPMREPADAPPRPGPTGTNGSAAPPGTRAGANGANGHAATGRNGTGNGHGNGHPRGELAQALLQRAFAWPGADLARRLEDARPRGAACATNGDVKDCCADGILEAETPLAAPAAAGRPATGEPRNFEEFIYRVWGAGIAKHFAIPYNRKLWAVPLSEMETSWLGGRVPLPDLDEMIEGALSPSAKPMGPNARFGYPLRGGFQALVDGFLRIMKAPLRLGAEAVRVSPSSRTVTFRDGSVEPWRVLVSTIPLPELIRRIGAEAPRVVREAAAGLRRVSVRCVNLGIGRPDLTDKHWIYYPEDTVFHRIFVQGNASPHNNPPGGFGLTCEITYSPHKPLPAEGDALVARCVEDARRVGLLRAEDPVWTASQVDMPYAYVVYDHGRRERVDTIRSWLLEQDILLAGRYSEWEYYNSDHAFLAGRRAAEQAQRIRAGGAAPASVPAGDERS